jgi:hypothetical protein
VYKDSDPGRFEAERVQEGVNMSRSVVVGALLFVSAVIASAQTAPQKPGPLDNLVPTLNPAIGPLQVDLTDNRQWRQAMRQKYEGKFPGPAPRTPEGKPDLSGVWIAENTPERPALTRLGLTLLEHRYNTNMKDYPYSFCLPMAPVPGDGLWVVMHNRAHLVTVFEYPPNYRLVFLDGRSHPPDLEPTWMGHSIAMWEGDTLVVDSIGFNDKSWFGATALAHTANLRVKERWTRSTMGAMNVEVINEDPEMFVKPWKVAFNLFLAPGENLMENICENNKFPQLSVGQNP